MVNRMSIKKLLDQTNEPGVIKKFEVLTKSLQCVGQPPDQTGLIKVMIVSR